MHIKEGGAQKIRHRCKIKVKIQCHTVWELGAPSRTPRLSFLLCTCTWYSHKCTTLSLFDHWSDLITDLIHSLSYIYCTYNTNLVYTCTYAVRLLLGVVYPVTCDILSPCHTVSVRTEGAVMWWMQWKMQCMSERRKKNYKSSHLIVNILKRDTYDLYNDHETPPPVPKITALHGISSTVEIKRFNNSRKYAFQPA